MNQVRKVNFIFLIMLFLSFMSSIVFGAIPSIRENAIASLLITQIVYIVPAILYLKSGGGNIRERLRINPIKWSTIPLLVLLYLFISPLMTYLNVISMTFAKNTIQNTIFDIVGNYPAITGVFIIAFVPCVFEEIIYRGVFFNEYRNVNPRKGIVLSGLIFGLMHLNFNQFMYAFVIGMIFALVVEACDSVVASMIVHFCINGSSTISAYRYVKTSNFEQLGQMQLSSVMNEEQLKMYLSCYWIVVLFSTILAYFLLKFIAKNEGRSNVFSTIFRKEETEGTIETVSTNKTKERFLTAPLVIGIVICFLFMIGSELP